MSFTTTSAVAPRRVILELAQSHAASEILAASAGEASLPQELDTARALSEAGLVVDPNWSAITLGAHEPPTGGYARRRRINRFIDSMYRLGDAMADALPIDVTAPSARAIGEQTILLRAELPTGDDGRTALEAAQALSVRVFADPSVTLANRRHDDDAHGTVADVEAALPVSALQSAGMTGDGVVVALVDAGVNLEQLTALGRNNPLAPQLSYTTSTTYSPGAFPVGHGTMAAFQVGIAAPHATLVDQASIIGSPGGGQGQPLIEALLSDIAPGYGLLHAHLLSLPLDRRAMVISNSWAVTRPGQDFPLGTPECFSDNREHPFNKLVRDVVALGADVVFAAGNCGETDPLDCEFASQPIRGANSLEEVLTIGAVDVDGVRLAYSSQGLGLLAAEKPDVCGYSHYAGSGVKPADWGTSTACPGVAGVVAAIRSVLTPAQLSPAELQDVIRTSAKRPAGATYNPDMGYGIIDADAILAHLRAMGHHV
jgi:subtilisin family serine protease